MDFTYILSNEFTPTWTFFYFSVIISLLGALIGHYRSNGHVQLPIILIGYKRTITFSNKNLLKLLMNGFLLVFDFLLYVLGFRIGGNKQSSAISIELGVLGDMLVGVGTGILAFAATGLTGTTNTLALITASFLAGYGGFAYIQKVQEDSLNEKAKPYDEKFNGTVVFPDEGSQDGHEFSNDIVESRKQASAGKE